MIDETLEELELPDIEIVETPGLNLAGVIE